MDAEKFLKEHIRMCLWYRKQGSCEGCFKYKEPCLSHCVFLDSFKNLDIQKYVAGVEQWSNDHPVKTRQQDFLEKYPDAEVFSRGNPQICCAYLGYRKYCNRIFDASESCDTLECFKCWNEPLEED